MFGKIKSSKLKPMEKSDLRWKGSFAKLESGESKMSAIRLIKEIKQKQKKPKSK